MVPTKADPIMKERSCNRGTVGVSGAGGIEIILVLLGDLRVWDDWLEPGGTSPCRTLLSSEGLPWSTDHLVRLKRGEAFLREQEPGVIAARWSLASSD